MIIYGTDYGQLLGLNDFFSVLRKVTKVGKLYIGAMYMYFNVGIWVLIIIILHRIIRCEYFIIFKRRARMCYVNYTHLLPL